MYTNTSTSCAYFFPSKTLVIDDSPEFLDSMALKLPFDMHSYEFFDNPQIALSYIKENLTLKKDLDEKVLELDPSKIYRKVFDKNRFNTITNIIIDYDMPMLNGLEFCTQLKDYNINKILLTGAADEKLAVTAFNENLINAFIPKHQSDIYQSLKIQLNKGAYFYFKNLSQTIFNSIELESIKSCLNSKHFINLFNTIVNKYNIVEYYFLEEDGGYLMLDIDGNASILFVASECTVNAFYQLAHEEEVDEEVLIDLKNYRKMVCCNLLDHKPLSVFDYLKYLQPITSIAVGEHKIYYFYEPKITLPESMSIFSFKDYISSI